MALLPANGVCREVLSLSPATKSGRADCEEHTLVGQEANTIVYAGYFESVPGRGTANIQTREHSAAG